MAITCLVIAACTNQNAKTNTLVEDDGYKLRIEYRKESKSFDLNLQSFASESICIPEMLWSDDKGHHYFNRYDDVYIVFDNTRFNLKSRSVFHCTPSEEYDCIQKIMPGEEMTGKIYLRDFEIDTDQLNSVTSEPNLYLPFEAYRC